MKEEVVFSLFLSVCLVALFLLYIEDKKSEEIIFKNDTCYTHLIVRLEVGPVKPLRVLHFAKEIDGSLKLIKITNRINEEISPITINGDTIVQDK